MRSIIIVTTIIISCSQTLSTEKTSQFNIAGGFGTGIPAEDLRDRIFMLNMTIRFGFIPYKRPPSVFDFYGIFDFDLYFGKPNQSSNTIILRLGGVGRYNINYDNKNSFYLFLGSGVARTTVKKPAVSPSFVNNNNTKNSYYISVGSGLERRNKKVGAYFLEISYTHIPNADNEAHNFGVLFIVSGIRTRF